MKRLIQKMLAGKGKVIVRKTVLDDLADRARAALDVKLLKAVPAEHRSRCIDHLDSSRAQLRQDLFVLSALDFKRDGYFVEFGATNGKDLSNTYLLEKGFGWDGILAEPARLWHAALAQNRNVNIDTKCVWKASGEILTFNQTEYGELSTIDSFSYGDMHKKLRRSGARYEVETITLLDLLEKYKAPEVIDYLSIDTEGSEYEILKDFDFGRYRFRVITCEHAYTPKREQIHQLLTEKGYVRVHEDISEFDDWFVLK